MDQTAACDSLFFPAWAFAASPVTQIVLRSQTTTSEEEVQSNSNCCQHQPRPYSRLNKAVVLWEEAAQGEVVSPLFIAVCNVVDHQDPVGHRVALPGVAVIPFRQQRGDAHHLCGRLLFLASGWPRRQLGAEGDCGHHEDGGQPSQ